MSITVGFWYIIHQIWFTARAFLVSIGTYAMSVVYMFDVVKFLLYQANETESNTFSKEKYIVLNILFLNTFMLISVVRTEKGNIKTIVGFFDFI